MRFKLFSTVAASLYLLGASFANAGRTCGNVRSAEEAAHAEQRYMARKTAMRIRTPADRAYAPAIINVHFHVIHGGDTVAQGNISDAQIADQIHTINVAYMHTGLAFKLVNTTRTLNKEWFEKLGPENAYNEAAKKLLRAGGVADLNVYSVGFTGGEWEGLLGYSSWPDDYAKRPWHDGVVIASNSLPGGAWAPFDLGHTLTHEAGHWFGLYHTFQGGCNAPGDFVDDTPAERSPASGCPATRDTCKTDNLPDPIHNYMDYSDDACMTEFTPGQAERLRSWLATYKGVPAA